MDAVAKLVSIAGEALAASENSASDSTLPNWPQIGELFSMLRMRNGFYAFEGALHVLPSGGESAAMNLERWNSGDLWRHEYGDLADGLLFFAEDAFGNQFCIRDDGVYSFDAETAEVDLLARTVADWARKILSGYELLTGSPLLHAWQATHARIPAGSRLMPILPFVLGGAYSLTNLRVVGSVSAMRSRGNLARQIHDLSDGTEIEFKIID